MVRNVTEFPVIARIQQLVTLKGWSYYRLAKQSGIPYSTLNTMMLKTNAPSIATLTKICHGLGISLAQFFDESCQPEPLTDEQRQCLEAWEGLDKIGREKAIAYMRGLHDGMRDSVDTEKK